MTIPTPKKYISDFEKLGFGMFVHWGLYSQLEKGEWVYRVDKMDMNEYEKLTQTFTAEDFDSDELAKLAKEAGCKYIVLTTRHHEGFSLFDTQGLSDFDVMHTPCKRDLIKEFTDSCRKYGIIPFLYHTTMDWHHKDYYTDFDSYLEYLRKSVEILCKNYGEIGGFWFDGNWDKKDSDWKEDELYGIIRKYQPNAMIINNTGLSARGEPGHIEIDSVTFEQGRPKPMNREGMRKYLAAEMCETLNDHWGYGNLDFNYKSPKHLIESLCQCRKVGANYLLNIGPEKHGKINDYQKETLRLLGKWVSVFSDAIYDVKPYVYSSPTQNFIVKGNDNKKLYIFYYNPGRKGNENVTVGNEYIGTFSFGGVTNKVKSVKWLDNNENLDFYWYDNMLTVKFTGQFYGSSYCVRVAEATIE